MVEKCSLSGFNYLTIAFFSIRPTTVFSFPSFVLFGVSRNRSATPCPLCLLHVDLVSLLISLSSLLIWCELKADCGNYKQTAARRPMISSVSGLILSVVTVFAERSKQKEKTL